MPVQHMVALKFKSEISTRAISDLFVQLHEFWSQVPGISYFASGPYSSPEGLNQGYTHGFLVTFDSPAARDAYLNHPEHQRLVELILPTIDGVLAFDFNAPAKLQ